MSTTTFILDLFGIAGILATVIGGFVVVRAAKEAKTAEVWKAEAEAQKARADRLQEDLTEIKDRLGRIEEENKRLVQLVSTIDPARLNIFRTH
ncbi:hypothetical protein DWB77_02127 [Streptomyces hundungensis]|uniref:Uncharacterized protein n=1 Tax=Streptomyces hundungensis TaxID=1077946 RepID=A0A387HH82_9ACTN|nr:hypothetical protein [Streptomyces hundungensis]AYG80007.1 hypothetical protein DWB77_02127 [Streptomyces hundungensis]